MRTCRNVLGLLQYRTIQDPREFEEVNLNKQDVEVQLGGCFLAIPALYNNDLSLNLAGMRQHVHFLIEHGLNVENSVVLVNGATGEFPVLTTEERKQTLETVVEAAGGKIAIIAGAQTSSTREAMEIAQHAQACGVTAVQVSPPFYYPPTDDDVFEHFAAIGSAAPKLGIVAYNTYWSGYNISVEMIGRLATIEQVVALKWCSANPLEYLLVFERFANDLGIIDNQLLPVANQMMGGIGANLHPAMFWPEWGSKVWELLKNKKWEEAQREVHRVLLPFYELFSEAAKYSGGEGHIDKVAMKMAGLPSSPNRPPTRPLPACFESKVEGFFDKIGFPR